MPELGKFQIITRGALLILQRFESNPWGFARWEDYSSGKNLDELHKFFLKEFAEYKDKYIAVDSSVPPYITDALRYIEQLMRRRGG